MLLTRSQAPDPHRSSPFQPVLSQQSTSWERSHVSVLPACGISPSWALRHLPSCHDSRPLWCHASHSSSLGLKDVAFYQLLTILALIRFADFPLVIILLPFVTDILDISVLISIFSSSLSGTPGGKKLIQPSHGRKLLRKVYSGAGSWN